MNPRPDRACLFSQLHGTNAQLLYYYYYYSICGRLLTHKTSNLLIKYACSFLSQHPEDELYTPNMSSLAWVVWLRSWVVWLRSWVAWLRSWVAWLRSWVVWLRSWVVWLRSWVVWLRSWVAWLRSWVAWLLTRPSSIIVCMLVCCCRCCCRCCFFSTRVAWSTGEGGSNLCLTQRVKYTDPFHVLCDI